MDLENKQIPIDLRALEQNVPDKLHPVLDFLVNNLRQIAWGVAGIVLLVAVYGVISHMRKSGEEKAQDELGLIVVQKVGAERLKALEAYVKTAPDALKAKANLELARIAMDEKAYDQAQAAWKALEGLGDPNLVFTARPNASCSRARTRRPWPPSPIFRPRPPRTPSAWSPPSWLRPPRPPRTGPRP
jgi:hypothetical protein